MMNVSSIINNYNQIPSKEAPQQNSFDKRPISQMGGG